jgi:RimJ/RimL family protein N-acetyltransferase
MASVRWPFFDLVVRTPRLTLRLPTDADLDALADLAAQGVHDPAEMPFTVPWTDLPPEERGRSVLQWAWRCRGELTADLWKLGFAVLEGGVHVGVQEVQAADFATTHRVETGSWLGLAHQGRGIGPEMRAAVLHLAFAGLGAERADTGAFPDNARSLSVTTKLGYEPNGDEVVIRRGGGDRVLRFTLARAAWEQRRRQDITVEGLQPCLPLLGACAPESAPPPS